MNVDTPAPLRLFLDEAKNQRRAKRPRMPGFKATRRGVDTIKKISECELYRLEVIIPSRSYGWSTFYIGTMGHTHIKTH